MNCEKEEESPEKDDLFLFLNTNFILFSMMMKGKRERELELNMNKRASCFREFFVFRLILLVHFAVYFPIASFLRSSSVKTVLAGNRIYVILLNLKRPRRQKRRFFPVLPPRRSQLRNRGDFNFHAKNAIIVAGGGGRERGIAEGGWSCVQGVIWLELEEERDGRGTQ